MNNNELDLVPPEYKSIVGVCSNGHYRCVGCSYAASDKPSCFKDYTGTYLASKIINPKLKKCPKGHNTKLIKNNPTKMWEYSCFSCNKKNTFDDENGVGYCQECNVMLCSSCMGFPHSLTF